MGELMTQCFSTLRSDDLFGKKDENGMYGGGLYRDIVGHLDKLEQDGVQTHIDKSWISQQNVYNGCFEKFKRL